MQNHYSMLYREEEREMVPTLKVCVQLRLATLIRFTHAGIWGRNDYLGSIGSRRFGAPI